MNSYKNSQSGRKLWTLSTKPPDNGDGAIVVAWNKNEDKYFLRNISMVITDFTYTFFCWLTESGKLQINSYQYLKPVMIRYKKNYHIAETMYLLPNCHQESSGLSSCHKTVSKRSSNCSQVGLLLSSQSTSVTLKWVTAKAGYGQWLELGSKKIVSQPIGNYQIPEGWSFLEVEPLLISPGVRVLLSLSLVSENLWTSCAVGIFFPFQFSDVSMWSRMWFFLSCFCLNIKVIETCVVLPCILSGFKTKRTQSK